MLLCAANTGVAKLTAAIAAPKISLAIFAMFVLCEWANKTIFCYLRRVEDWITLPQIPSRFLEHNAEPVDTAGHVSQRLVRLYERIG
ncbi:MAG: hypothetical protein WBG18_03365 [Xanthobacteraceae bacterium]